MEEIDIDQLTDQEKERIATIFGIIKESCIHPLDFRNQDLNKCLICGEWLGHWCPDSPDHTCYYYGIHEGGYNPYGSSEEEYYDEDDCIYCHEPEERK